jgi:hypothetical protein
MVKTLYVRLYGDAKGESHFSDEEMQLKSDNFASPAPPVEISAFIPATHIVFLHTPPGWFGDWHFDSSFSLSVEMWKSGRAKAMCDASGQKVSCSWTIQQVEAIPPESLLTVFGLRRSPIGRILSCPSLPCPQEMQPSSLLYASFHTDAQY